MSITIYHNPACGTSRNTLALIRNTGAEPEVIEYLKHPPSLATLTQMIADAGLTVRDAMRQKEKLYTELALDNATLTDAQLLHAMLTHPSLINRPFVVTPVGTRLCRPSELLLDILPAAQTAPFTKEDGEVVINAEGKRVSNLTEQVVKHISGHQPEALVIMPHLRPDLFHKPVIADFTGVTRSSHAPRFLLLYGSLREKSYSRFLTEEAARLLEAMGGEVKIFDPRGLPLPDAEPETHPKVAELRALAQWAEGMVWCSPERHGAMTGIMKAQIDWIPLSMGAVRPTQGKTLAVMEVSGGSQSFNALNQMRILGRWMRMITIPNQSSVAKAFLEFDDTGRMKPSAYYDRVVDVMEELFKFTLLTRNVSSLLVDRYSERKESAEELSKRVNQVAI